MSTPSSLNEKERADLVAYLDGELQGEAARALEAKLNLDPAARAEAEALRRTWDLLDFLPPPPPSPNFTHRTMERLAPIRATGAASYRGRVRRWLLRVGWAAALVLATFTGFVGYKHLVPHQPGDRELVRELSVIENKPLYDPVEDVDFLKALDQPDLFGDDNTGS